MAKIIRVDDEFVSIRLRNGSVKEYSRETCDFEPELDDNVDFKRDADGNVVIFRTRTDTAHTDTASGELTGNATKSNTASEHIRQFSVCPYCYKTIRAGSKFCPVCGHALAVSEVNPSEITDVQITEENKTDNRTETETPGTNKTTVVHSGKPDQGREPQPSAEKPHVSGLNGKKKKIRTIAIIAGALAAFLIIHAVTYVSPEAKAVKEQIAAIDTVSLNSSDEIAAARNAYELLEDKDKKDISNYKDLVEAEDAYDQLKAGQVAGLIDEIGTVTIESGETIKKAQDAYGSLTDRQKAYVANFDALKDAQSTYDQLLAAETDELIHAMLETSSEGNGYTEEIAAAIKAAEDSYNSLTADQKDLVRYHEILDEISADYSEYQIMQAQAAMNNALNSGTGYEEAQNLYDALNASQKADVKGYETFAAAKEKAALVQARQDYIDSCDAVSYNDLLQYPDTYENKNVAVTVYITDVEPDGWIFPGDIMGVVSGTSSEIAVRDNRENREPRIIEGETITIYGTGGGIGSMKVYKKGTGLFGSDLFADTVDEYNVPVICVTYTSKDNLSAPTPGAADSTSDDDWSEKGAEMGEKLTEWLNKLDSSINGTSG